jgi:hypothetical protein
VSCSWEVVWEVVCYWEVVEVGCYLKLSVIGRLGGCCWEVVEVVCYWEVVVVVCYWEVVVGRLSKLFFIGRLL